METRASICLWGIGVSVNKVFSFLSCVVSEVQLEIVSKLLSAEETSSDVPLEQTEGC